MPNDKINHTRIKNFIKKSVDDCKISSDLYPEVENYLLKLIDDLIKNVKKNMDLIKKKSLNKDFLSLGDRFLELGKEQNFTFTEIENVIREHFEKDIWIRNGFVEMVRGYLYDQLRDKIKQARLALEFSSDKMLCAKHFKLYAKY